MVPSASELQTDRLRLRRWIPEDREPFYRLNADLRVCEFLPNTLSRTESDALADRIEKHFREHQYGLWAVEILESSIFIGFVGLSIPRYETHFTPCVEIGWRLSAESWGQGYATEAAQVSLAYGFQSLKLEEIVSLTVPQNLRSRRVMEKIGMQRDPTDDFDHPSLPAGHPLSRHVLYRARPTSSLLKR